MLKVWFGCTTLDWPKYRDTYFLIRDYLVELGCVVLFDWLECADEKFKNPKIGRDIKKIYKEVIKAIEQADACVIEYSVPNFSSSHQINYSLLRRKPTLVLRTQRDNPRFKDSYIEAIDSEFLVLENYTDTNVKKILRKFIGYSSVENGPARYNVVLDKKHKYYLDWMSTKHHKSRSKIIRDMIDLDIQSNKFYNSFIENK